MRYDSCYVINQLFAHKHSRVSLLNKTDCSLNRQTARQLIYSFYLFIFFKLAIVYVSYCLHLSTSHNGAVEVHLTINQQLSPACCSGTWYQWAVTDLYTLEWTLSSQEAGTRRSAALCWWEAYTPCGHHNASYWCDRPPENTNTCRTHT